MSEYDKRKRCNGEHHLLDCPTHLARTKKMQKCKLNECPGVDNCKACKFKKRVMHTPEKFKTAPLPETLEDMFRRVIREELKAYELEHRGA